MTTPVSSETRNNRVTHAYNIITTPDDTNALGGTAISELGTISYVKSAYTQKYANIAVFATGRGVGIKELGAIAAGGVNYDSQSIELGNAITKLTQDMQYYILQGNSSNASGTSTNEGGAYNTLGFDGLRGIVGSQGTYASNNAIQLDIGALNLTESIQTVATRSANNGGNPSLVALSLSAKQALDIEQQNNRRYNDNLTQVVPGVSVNSMVYANGTLDILPIPGNTVGSYNRATDNALVEDIYILDESTITLRWLYAPTFTVVQIPTGVDGQLSNRYLIFMMLGAEFAAPLFLGKCRRLFS